MSNYRHFYLNGVPNKFIEAPGNVTCTLGCYGNTGPIGIDGVCFEHWDIMSLGASIERERIIKLWDEEMSCNCENPMPHLLQRIKEER